MHYLLLIFCLLLCNTSFSKDILTWLDEEQVKFVNFLFCDIHGNAKEITVPIHHLPEVLEHGLAFDGSSIQGCSNISTSDMLLKPDIKTTRIIPWFVGLNKSAIIMCDIYKDIDKPHTGNPREILKNVMQEAEDLGYIFNVGPELEFFLVKNNGTEPLDNNGYCCAESNAQLFIHKSSLLHILTNMNINIEKLHHEVASGQHEISLRYGNALEIADQIILTKFTLKSVTQEYGYKVSFMPKPFANQNGSAMHIHFSLWDTFENKNAFSNGIDYKISTLGQEFISGVLYHINDLAALFNPTINSYKRLVPGYEAPIYVCWGTKNRSALVRVPQVFNQHAVRAELRCPDPMCNPYLAFAALLKAGLDGIKNKRSLMAPIEENLYKISHKECTRRNIRSLPLSLEEALYNLKQSSLASALMGRKNLQQFLRLKKKEVFNYNTHISAWEFQQYM